MQHHAADQLDVEMALAQGALGGLADRGEGRNQEIVEVAAVGEFLAERARCGPSVVIRKAASSASSALISVDPAPVFGDLAVIGRAENFAAIDAQSEHVMSFLRGGRCRNPKIARLSSATWRGRAIGRVHGIGACK